MTKETSAAQEETQYLDDLIVHYQTRPYVESGIEYDVEQQTFGRNWGGNIILTPTNNPSARIVIINSGQMWGTRKFFFDGQELPSQEEFERRIKLMAFE